MSSLQETLGVSPTKVPMGIEVFLSYMLPPVACYIIVAMLAVTPQTRAIRVALWPVMALLGFRAAVSVDIKPEKEFREGELTRTMIFLSLNALTWTFAKEPLVRHLRPANSSPSTIMDALDLTSNFRCYGWNFSRGLYVPRETRPTSRVAFAFCALLSGIARALLGAILYRVLHTFVTGVGSGSKEHSIFDGSLPFFVRYFRASIITIISGLATYTTLQLKYSVFTVLGILFLGQDPAQWPPAFDKPWCATSLCDFWNRRWHQFFRHMFLLGAYPVSLVFGRVGWIMGAFLASAVFHQLMMLTFDYKPEIWRMSVGFGMMGLGVVAERAFYKATGRKVGGMVGRVWTATWVISWGSMIVDGFMKAGAFDKSNALDSQLPMGEVIEKLVIGFDAWLHTI